MFVVAFADIFNLLRYLIMIKYSSGFSLGILDSSGTFSEMIGNIRITFVQYWDNFQKMEESCRLHRELDSSVWLKM